MWLNHLFRNVSSSQTQIYIIIEVLALINMKSVATDIFRGIDGKSKLSEVFLEF